MKKVCFFIIVLLLNSSLMYSQVSVTADGSQPDPSSMLDVKAANKGILIPRMTQGDRNTITSPANGLLIYQTDNSAGFYYNSGTNESPVWTPISTGNNWSLTGNSGTTAGTNFIGTKDYVPLVFKVNNQQAGIIDFSRFLTSFGCHALAANTTGYYNSAFGHEALASNASGMGNTAMGTSALNYNISGLYNTANGYNSLMYNTANSNSAYGYASLRDNSTGTDNAAFGISAMLYNTAAGKNTAVGAYALIVQSYDPGTAWSSENVALGYYSLYWNQPTSIINGIRNTSSGTYAMTNNTTGSHNAAYGYKSMYNNTTGFSNVAVGTQSLYNNTTRSNLVAVGDSALFNNDGVHNTAIGSKALFANVSGYANTAIGYESLKNNYSASGNTAIGDLALTKQSFNPGYLYYTDNVAVGEVALFSNQPTAVNNGIDNTAIGAGSLYNNTTGSYNTATGNQALGANGTGNNNTSNGCYALLANTTGNSNVAVGTFALFDNTTTSNLVAVGDSALYNNNGVQNTAVGSKALYANYTGSYNSSAGFNALYNNTSGEMNTALGTSAQLLNQTGSSNTAIGMYANYYTTSSYNTSVGFSAGDYNTFINGTFLGSCTYPSSSGYTNCMALGFAAVVDGSNKVVVGNTSVSSIGGYAGWSNFSDGRFKRNVSENVPGLAFISQLHPVTYNIDVNAINEALNRNRSASLRDGEKEREITPEERESADAKSKIVYTGFIAQDVEAAAKTIGYDFSGVDAPQNPDGHYGLRYAEFVVPLVKAVQEQQAMIEDLRLKNEELKIQNEEMLRRIEALENK